MQPMWRSELLSRLIYRGAMYKVDIEDEDILVTIPPSATNPKSKQYICSMIVEEGCRRWVCKMDDLVIQKALREIVPQPGVSDVGDNPTPQTPTLFRGVGTAFVELLPEDGDIDWFKDREYGRKAIPLFKTYETEMNKMVLSPFDVDKASGYMNHTYIYEYVKEFFNQIWNHVSNHNYPDEYLKPPRPNHGTLNHLRCLVFGSHMITLLMRAKPDIFHHQSLPFHVMLLCSTPFESIMRIDEQGSFWKLGKFVNMEYYERLYGSAMNKYRGGNMSPHQLASSCFYKVVMGACFGHCVPEAAIQMLARGVSYHFHGGLDLTISPPSDDFWFFLYYTIIISGHYLDHCRGTYSDMINNPDIRTLLDLFKVDERKRQALMYDVISTMKATETHNPSQPIPSNKPYAQMRPLCETYVAAHRRWGGREGLYDNFEIAWKETKLPSRLQDLIAMYPHPPPG